MLKKLTKLTKPLVEAEEVVNNDDLFSYIAFLTNWRL
jgi:hypothetical protein